VTAPAQQAAPLSRGWRDLPTHLKVGRYKSATFWNAHEAGYFDPRPADLDAAQQSHPIVNGFRLGSVHRDLDCYEEDLAVLVRENKRVQRAVSSKLEDTGYPEANTLVSNIRALRAQLDVWGEPMKSLGDSCAEMRVERIAKLIGTVAVARRTPTDLRPSEPEIHCGDGSSGGVIVADEDESLREALAERARLDPDAPGEIVFCAEVVANTEDGPNFDPIKSVGAHLYESGLAELVEHGQAANQTQEPSCALCRDTGIVRFKGGDENCAACHARLVLDTEPPPLSDTSSTGAAPDPAFLSEPAYGTFDPNVHVIGGTPFSIEDENTWDDVCAELNFNLGLAVRHILIANLGSERNLQWAIERLQHEQKRRGIS